MKNIIAILLSLLLCKVSISNAEEILIPLPLDLATFEKSLKSNSFIILDTRSAKEFAEGHIKKSVFLGIDGPFEAWSSTAVRNKDQFLLIIADEGKEKEVLQKLGKNGYFHVKGFLKGGIEIWKEAGKPLQKVEEVDAVYLESILNKKNKQIIDVRKSEEFQQNHLIGAYNKPISDLPVWSKELKARNNYYVHCTSGYRSMIAVSLLQLQGAENVINIKGGYKAIQANQNLKHKIKTND